MRCSTAAAGHRARGAPLSQGLSPNDLWCADFKGELKLGNGRDCFSLAVSDHAARFVLLCEALDSTREDPPLRHSNDCSASEACHLPFAPTMACLSPVPTPSFNLSCG